ncbi:hypothetical protein FNV43_RR08990 [Rhamnella rubrinervis]|uniref:Uncharacterized protein n=1 Tax=Rhamnella rubrinervis TaxID=2594499 RepID=A0A8K0H972_9ROSA|nr:hypothetical protein FNV43_RR08990 [Rhamnella rubrinervis]
MDMLTVLPAIGLGKPVGLGWVRLNVIISIQNLILKFEYGNGKRLAGLFTNSIDMNANCRNNIEMLGKRIVDLFWLLFYYEY